ncbi:MAG: hypothetical protein WCB01_07540 [Candidatus Cybelea sp.]
MGIFDTYYTYEGIPVIARYRRSVLPGNHPHFEYAGALFFMPASERSGRCGAANDVK